MTRSKTKTLSRLIIVVGVFLLARPSLAHAGSLGSSGGSATVPLWLVILTGGGIIGASFMFASFATDRDLIHAVHRWRILLPSSETVYTLLKWGAQAMGVVTLVVVVIIGLLGPQEEMFNLAILLVWGGWWAGYTMSVYLIGNTWPVLNPWGTISSFLPRLGDIEYPESIGAWPSVVGLLALVWIEVISPISSDPRLLTAVIIAYTVVTLVGTTIYGTDTWFSNVDPIYRVFKYYGSMAPFQRTEDGFEFKLPSMALAEIDFSERAGETAFIIALLWVTTYDGLVSTPAWNAVIRSVVGVGVPPLVVYIVTILGGFVFFFSVYQVASHLSPRIADSYVSPDFIAKKFGPSLIPIAAGYHLAHFLGFFISLSPALFAVLVSPFNPPSSVNVLVLPEWFGMVQLGFVLLGHIFAIWIAHTLSFGVFVGRLQPIRSQYPFIAVMVFYTMTSMWVIIQPYASPAYV